MAGTLAGPDARHWEAIAAKEAARRSGDGSFLTYGGAIKAIEAVDKLRAKNKIETYDEIQTRRRGEHTAYGGYPKKEAA